MKSITHAILKKNVTKQILVNFMEDVLKVSKHNTKRWFAKKNKHLDNFSPNQLIKRGEIQVVIGLLWDMAMGNPM